MLSLSDVEELGGFIDILGVVLRLYIIGAAKTPVPDSFLSYLMVWAGTTSFIDGVDRLRCTRSSAFDETMNPVGGTGWRKIDWVTGLEVWRDERWFLGSSNLNIEVKADG